MLLQARMRAISDIVNALVQGIKSGNDVDLNKLNRDVGVKYSLARLPKLVEIIAALPDEHRAALLPQYVLLLLFRSLFSFEFLLWDLFTLGRRGTGS